MTRSRWAVVQEVGGGHADAWRHRARTNLNPCPYHVPTPPRCRSGSARWRRSTGDPAAAAAALRAAAGAWPASPARPPTAALARPPAAGWPLRAASALPRPAAAQCSSCKDGLRRQPAHRPFCTTPPVSRLCVLPLPPALPPARLEALPCTLAPSAAAPAITCNTPRTLVVWQPVEGGWDGEVMRAVAPVNGRRASQAAAPPPITTSTPAFSRVHSDLTHTPTALAEQRCTAICNPVLHKRQAKCRKRNSWHGGSSVEGSTRPLGRYAAQPDAMGSKPSPAAAAAATARCLRVHQHACAHSVHSLQGMRPATGGAGGLPPGPPSGARRLQRLRHTGRCCAEGLQGGLLLLVLCRPAMVGTCLLHTGGPALG